jgi:integrase
MATKSKCWRRTLGEPGLRVHVFERRPGGNLYREVFVDGKRAAPKKSLRHRDKERALSDAYELLARLKAHDDVLRSDKLTLSVLFDMYLVSPQHRAKKRTTRQDDKAKAMRLQSFLGPDREVRTLSYSDVERYRQARMNGEIPGLGRVRARAVASDLVLLVTVLNWATRERDAEGRFLLEVNPLRGVKLPVEKNPRRPVETYDRYLRLMDVAEQVDWRLPLALTLAESTGQRIGSILKLRRGDLDLEEEPFGWVNFRAEHQKTGFEHRVPLSETCREVLEAHLEHLPDDAEAWLFPSDRVTGNPITRWGMDGCLRKAYEGAGVARLEKGLWHPWRRKWATERKDLPLKDVAAAGGWRDYDTLIRSYQQTDRNSVLRVVLGAPKLNGFRGVDGQKTTPKTTPQAAA